MASQSAILKGHESMVQKPLLSEDGVLNVRALEKELAEAIEFDRVYKRTDEVKKRAIHTSANYDEFKVGIEWFWWSKYSCYRQY